MNEYTLLRAAGGAVSSYLLVKLALPAGAVFLALLLLVGTLADPGEALSADPCGDRGQPDVEVSETGGGHHDKQIANAKVIDQVAIDEGLPGYATLIALMTALQESSLLNLDHGDRDSLGLFQQRPSQGWGSAAQLKKPAYAATMFFLGDEDGSPRGLTDINGWQDMPAGKAAQAVQHSAYPDLYAGQQTHAMIIAKDAEIDLKRSGDSNDQSRKQPEKTDRCYPGKPGKTGEPFRDSAADWPQAVRNPRSTADAIAWARKEAETGGKDWYRRCLAFVAIAYGWNYSGVLYAIDHYRQMPKSMQHDTDRNPPPGALLYWDTGNRAGHVAVYLGGGKIASNDIERPGYIDIADATAPESEWSAKYLGWAPPSFPQGG